MSKSFQSSRTLCDIVVANSVLEHVRDYDGALANIYRGLRPGGLFVFELHQQVRPTLGRVPGHSPVWMAALWNSR